jgi:hypothetical protein
LAALTAIALIAAPAAYALSATPLERAELAGLSPAMRAQVEARAVGGNSVTEVLQVMLLNNIKIKYEASLIVALDWGKGVAVVQLPSGGLTAVQFDPRRYRSRASKPTAGRSRSAADAVRSIPNLTRGLVLV